MWCAQINVQWFFFGIEYGIVKKERRKEWKTFNRTMCVCVQDKEMYMCRCDINHIHNTHHFSIWTVLLHTHKHTLHFISFRPKAKKFSMTNLSFIHCQWKISFSLPIEWHELWLFFYFHAPGSVYCLVWPIEMQLSYTHAHVGQHRHTHWLATTEIASNHYQKSNNELKSTK